MSNFVILPWVINFWTHGMPKESYIFKFLCLSVAYKTVKYVENFYVYSLVKTFRNSMRNEN
jgi:hypothetical protein